MIHTMNVSSDMNALRCAIHKRMADLASYLYGSPNRKLSSRTNWRYGTHGSLSVMVGGPKIGSYFDHEAGKGGDVFDLISLRLELDFLPAKQWAIQFVGGHIAVQEPIEPLPMLAAANDNYTELAERIWRQAIEPRGTIVESYLAGRLLPIPAEIAD